MKQKTKTLGVASILVVILFLSCVFALLPQSVQAATLTTTVAVGNGAGGVAVTPNGEYVYVTNNNDNTVSVISTTNNTVTATVAVGNGPEGVAVTPNGEYVYVTNNYHGTVSVISTTNNTVTATVTVGNGPGGIAITPNGAYVYVTNNNDNTVSVISTTNNTVTATVAVGNGPGGIAITPNGAYAYITNQYSGNSVSVINTTTNTVTETVLLGGYSYYMNGGSGGIAITPNGGYVYVTNSSYYGSNSVSVINTTTNTVTATVDLGGESNPYGGGSGGVAITPNGEYVYATSSDWMSGNSVSVISTATNTVTETVLLGGSSYYMESGSGGVTITPNGAYAYVTSGGYGSNTVSVINTSEIDTFEITVSQGANGVIAPGTTTVDYGADQEFTFTPATGYHIVAIIVNGSSVGTTSPYTVSDVTEATSVTAVFAIDTFTVTVGDHTHGSISSTNGTTVNYGNDLSFSITPDTGYHLVSVLIDGETASAPYNFVNVTAAHTISATFAIDTFTVTVGDHTHGSISSTNGTTVNYGNDLSFSITPDTGYHLVSVLIDGETASAPYNFVNVTAAHTISATFAIDTFTVTVGDHTHGSISSTNGTTVNYGNDLSFSITPDTGYHLVSVLIDGETASAPYNFVNVTAAHTISATFAIDTFTVTVGDHTHGSISSTNGTTVNYGNDLSFSITPDTGYHLVSVLIDGETASAPYNFVNVTAAHTISATFAIDTFTVTVGDHTHGSISSTNGTTVNYGNDLSFSITPDTGYHLVSVLIDGETASAPYNFVNVTAAHTISATFAIDTFTVTVGDHTHGSISSTNGTTVNYGNDLSFSITPDTGYHLVSVLIDGETASAPYNFVNVTAAHTISATFAIDTFTVTVGDHTHGSISSTNGTTVNYGNDLSFSITPDTGYHLVSVLIDGETASAPYNFVNVTAAHTISATFAIDTFTVTVGDHTHGSISSTNGTTVNYGNDLSFSITPDTGYHLVSVLIDGETASAPYNFVNVTAAHTISATFAIDTFTVTVGDHTHGSISSTNGTTVNYGNDLSFSITPDTGYHLVSVLIDGETASAPYNFVNVTAAHTISATFAIDTYAITVSQGANGVIAPGTTTVDYGADQEFTFTPATGYHIVEVKMNGTTVTTTSQHTVSNVTAATSLTAEFAINTYSITITHSANGFISGPSYANYGTDASYTIVPVTGYHIVNVIVDGVSKGATASYTISNTQATHTVTAIFAVNIDAITATVTTTGDTYGVEISGNVTAQQMSNVTITPHQLTTTTIVSFTITGPSGTVGFGNMTLPKTAIPYGTNPVVYIDGNQALNQGYTQDTNNFYVWYTTNFSTHEMTILFRSTPSLTPTATPNPPASMSLSVPVIGAIVLICLVLIGLLVKRKKNQNPQVLT